MQASDLCSSTSSDRAAATGRDCVRRAGAICVVRAFPRATGEAPSRQTPKFEASLRRPQTASPVGFVEGETLICLLASQPLRLLAVLEVGCVGESTSPADSISRPLSMWLHWPQLALLILKRAGAETAFLKTTVSASFGRPFATFSVPRSSGFWPLTPSGSRTRVRIA